MGKKPNKQDSLRAEAEAQLSRNLPAEAAARATEELLHELQVYQIELEMQNEELRRTQIALEESRDRYADLYEFAPVAYLTLTLAGQIAEVNLTGATLLGMARQKLLHRSFDSLVAQEERNRWHRQFISAIAHEDERQTIELPLIRGDGSVFHSRLDGLRVVVNNAPPMIRIMLADITERKLAEHVQLRLSRALRLLSACNMALVRADNEQALFDSICRLIVETGGYLMAWVGIAEHDAEKTVRVVSRYGDETEYLDTIRVSWGDFDIGRGPTGMAIKSGVTQVIQNSLSSPAMAPWRDAALKRGYQSCASFPLVDYSGVFGVLTLYASEPNAFGSDEVKLLEELAGDLAFGIGSLRSRTARLQVERDLLLTQERLLGLFGSIQDAVFVLGLRDDGMPGCFVDVNNVACKRLGYSRAELLALSPMDIDAPECHADIPPTTNRLITQKTAVFERIHLTRDGRRIPVEISASSFTLRGQKMVVALARDITERKQAEEMLRYERDFAEGLVNTAQTIILVLDPQGCILRINPYMEVISGYTLAEVQGKDWFSIFLPKRNQARTKAMFLSALNDIQTYGDIDAIITRDGQERFVEWYDKTLKDSAGKIVGLLAIGQDVTERLQIEAALLASEQEFRSLAENLPDIVMRYDRGCQCTYVNPACEREIGVTANLTLNVTPDVQWHGKLSMPMGKYKSRLHQVMETGEPAELMVSWHRMPPDGAIVYHALHIVAEHDNEGHVKGTLAIGRNITDLLEAKRRLEESRKQLRTLAIRRESAREEERHHIARELHDELGQHLTALRIGISLLDFQFNKHLPRIHETTVHLLGLADKTIQIMRDVSSSLRPTALDLGIVPALEWLAAEFSRHTGIPCDLDVPRADIPLREEQAVTLFRIAQESMTNAARHSKTERIQIAFECGSDGYMLEIRDNGVGFDCFDQCKQKSYGLIGIRERALAIGGEVDISSEIGRGTVVRVCIPVTKDMGGES